MFAQTNRKPKFSVGTGASQRAPPNSHNRFVHDLNASDSKLLLNQSIDSAEKHLRNRTFKHLRQTTLCMSTNTKKPKLEYSCGAAQTTQKSEFFLLPVPESVKQTFNSDKKINFKKLQCQVTLSLAKKHAVEQQDCKSNVTTAVESAHTSKHTPGQNSKQKDINNITHFMSQNGRDMISLYGKIDFVFQLHKEHPNLNVMWNAYGKILKIKPGRNRYQHMIVLRNDNTGPVIQSSYYDFDNKIRSFGIGDYVRVVGHMTSLNVLKTFLIEKIDEATWQANFNRLHSLANFAVSK